MPSARSAILTTIVVLVLSVAYSTWSLMGPPDSGGRGRDSFGTRWHGGRAWFELLAESGVRVERRLSPPSTDVPAGTYVLWMPDTSLTDVEPAYLQKLRQWIESGNRAVVAPAPTGDDVFSHSSLDGPHGFEEVLRVLGVEGITAEQTALPDSSERVGETDRERIRREARETWDEVFGQRDFRVGEVTARPTGEAFSSQRIKKLHAPLEGLRYLDVNQEAMADVRGSIRLDLPDDPIVVTVMPAGEGEVVVVAEPYLLANYALARADNAALAYDLAGAGERTVTFDEFYHGLAVRGNPLWLLTQPVYASIIASCAIVAGLLLWRRATAFGPPLEPELPTRRTVVEYVEATGKFFAHSRGAPRYVLDEIRNGALHVLAERRHGGDAVDASPDAVLAALSRRAPAEAVRLRKALADLDAAEALGDGCTRSQAVQALQGILHCLSHSSTK